MRTFGYASIHIRAQITVATGTISTIGGTGTFADAGDGGPATSASFYCTGGISLDSSSNVYVADKIANKVRKVSTIL